MKTKRDWIVLGFLFISALVLYFTVAIPLTILIEFCELYVF